MQPKQQQRGLRESSEYLNANAAHEQGQLSALAVHILQKTTLMRGGARNRPFVDMEMQKAKVRPTKSAAEPTRSTWPLLTPQPAPHCLWATQ